MDTLRVKDLRIQRLTAILKCGSETCLACWCDLVLPRWCALMLGAEPTDTRQSSAQAPTPESRIRVVGDRLDCAA